MRLFENVCRIPNLLYLDVYRLEMRVCEFGIGFPMCWLEILKMFSAFPLPGMRLERNSNGPEYCKN